MTFSARMSNRGGVGKVMIVVTCDKITEGTFYGEAMTMLQEENIQLHYINPATLKLRTKKSRTIFGYDKTSVFTSKHLKAKTGDSRLRDQMKVPKDYVSTLATESGGSVFSQVVLNQSSKDQKTAASIFGRRVAESGVPSCCQVNRLYILFNYFYNYTHFKFFRTVTVCQTERVQVAFIATSALLTTSTWCPTLGTNTPMPAMDMLMLDTSSTYM